MNESKQGRFFNVIYTEPSGNIPLDPPGLGGPIMTRLIKPVPIDPEILARAEADRAARAKSERAEKVKRHAEEKVKVANLLKKQKALYAQKSQLAQDLAAARAELAQAAAFDGSASGARRLVEKFERQIADLNAGINAIDMELSKTKRGARLGILET